MSLTDAPDIRQYRGDLGKELRRIRKLQGVSVERLAEATGLHQNTIGCIERGSNDIKLVSNARIMAALGCESFDIGETTFSFNVEELADYPERRDVLRLPASSIVYMTGRTIRERRTAMGITILELSESAGKHPVEHRERPGRGHAVQPVPYTQGPERVLAEGDREGPADTGLTGAEKR